MEDMTMTKIDRGINSIPQAVCNVMNKLGKLRGHSAIARKDGFYAPKWEIESQIGVGVYWSKISGVWVYESCTRNTSCRIDNNGNFLEGWTVHPIHRWNLDWDLYVGDNCWHFTGLVQAGLKTDLRDGEPMTQEIREEILRMQKTTPEWTPWRF